MALKDHLPRWAQRLLVAGSNALGIHDALEATFTELAGDVAQGYADTLIPEASSEGLDRWGLDLLEERQPGQTDLQYSQCLLAVKQGLMVSDEGITFALDKWNLPYALYEFGDAAAYWDQGFYDLSTASVPVLTLRIEFLDPFNGQTPSDADKADAQRRMNNAIRDVTRVKARGVRIEAIVPSSLQ